MNEKSSRGVPRCLDTVYLDRVDEPIRLITVSKSFLPQTAKQKGVLRPKSSVAESLHKHYN